MDTAAPTHHDAPAPPMTIGQLARATGLGVETIRFYERRGLIAEPPRRASGYRQYPPSEIRRLRFVRRAKELGFTLREIHDLLALTERSDATCRQVRARAQDKAAQVRAKIRDLQAIEAALTRLAQACPGEEEPLSQCPVLEALTTPRDHDPTRSTP